MHTYLRSVFKPFYYCSLATLAVIVSCNQKGKQDSLKDTTPQPTVTKEADITKTFEANITKEIGNNVLSIFQDSKGHYWFGTQSLGVYYYDGKTLLRFTETNGLANNQVQNIQEDHLGNIWFGTGVFGVTRFDGQTFTTLTNQHNIPVEKVWSTAPQDLLFYAGGGAFKYSNNSLSYLPFPGADVQSTPNQLSAYAVYSMLKDRKGNYWFGTQSMGVARYSFTWFTEKGLAGPAVLALFEDSRGNIWFGNNGSGLFKYDGKSLINFTAEKGLGNAEFFKTSKVSVKSSANTMSRIYSINEDNNGNIWIGTVDTGVWKYDGKNLTNYTTKDGLTSNAVTAIYKDKKGELWFGTEGHGVLKFNGKSFTAFTF